MKSASELSLARTSCSVRRAYLNGRTKKKPAILTSRALIGFPVSTKPIGVGPVDDVNKTPLVGPQEGQPEKSKGPVTPAPITPLEEMSWRCRGRLPNPRFFAFTEDGNVALFERRGSNADWLSIGVSNIPEDTCWHFGWNGTRMSLCNNSEHLRLHHRDVFTWAVSVLEELTDGKGNFEMRACRRDWLTRDRAATVETLERKAAHLVEIDQQIAALDAEPCPDQQQDEVHHTTEVHG